MRVCVAGPPFIGALGIRHDGCGLALGPHTGALLSFGVGVAVVAVVVNMLLLLLLLLLLLMLLLLFVVAVSVLLVALGGGVGVVVVVGPHTAVTSGRFNVCTFACGETQHLKYANNTSVAV